MGGFGLCEKRNQSKKGITLFKAIDEQTFMWYNKHISFKIFNRKIKVIKVFKVSISTIKVLFGTFFVSFSA